MPKVTNIENFPAVYFRIANDVGAGGYTFRVPREGPLPDGRDSSTGEVVPALRMLNKLRGHFYAFKGSLKRAKSDPKYEDVYLASCRVACYLDTDNLCLEFRPTDKTWHAQALASGGPVEGDVPSGGPAGVEESFEKLVEKLQINGEV
jgi:hypothetical protein